MEGMIPSAGADDSRSASMVAGAIPLGVVAFLSVILRLVSRRMMKLDLAMDDWLILTALPIALALVGVSSGATAYGLGKHTVAIPASDLVIESKMVTSVQLLWAASTPLVKLSILALYLRIFRPATYLRWSVYALSTFTVCWMISTLLVLGLQCQPLSMLWDHTVKGHCLDFTLFFIVGSATDVFTDFAILVIPLPAVWNLHLSVARKIALSTIFILGSLTCVISLIRILELRRAIMHMDDFTWTGIMAYVWSDAEPCLGIMCACLPCVLPFFQALGRKYRTVVMKIRPSSQPQFVVRKPSRSTSSDEEARREPEEIASHHLEKTNGFSKGGFTSHTYVEETSP